MSTINSPCARWVRQNCGKFSITGRLSKQVIFPLDVAKVCPIHCRLHVLKREKQFNEPTPVCLNQNGDLGLAPFAPKLVVRYESDAPSCVISLQEIHGSRYDPQLMQLNQMILCSKIIHPVKGKTA